VIAEEFQLGFQGLLDSSPNDSLADVDGHGFDRFEVYVETRPLLTVSAPGNNSPPAVGHIAKLRRLVDLNLGERHGEFFLELGERSKMGNSY
jgi:hypothetical protein